MITLRQNKGFALTFSLIFLFLIISFMSVYMLAVASGVSTANRTANLKKAYYIADAGLADAYERITQNGLNNVASSTCTNPNIPSTCTNPYIPSANTDTGIYRFDPVNNSAITGSYRVSIVYSNSPRANYTITSTGTYGNISRTLQLKIIGAAISKYAYWTDMETSPYYGGNYWITGNLVNGLFQTNGTVNIIGNPIFNGAVSQVGPSVDYVDNTSNPSLIFPDGVNVNAPVVNLPAAQTLNAILGVANNSQGLVLTGASTIIFNPDSTITVTGVVNNPSGGAKTYNNTTIKPPANGVIYVQNTPGQNDGSATVQGTVNGQLTVAAEQNIYIAGNVAYNSDPRTNPGSLDMVGLVANQNIYINSSAPSNLELSGVLVALQSIMQAADMWVQGKRNMDQFGSTISFYPPAMGYCDWSGNLLSGWNQLQSYDSRLKTLAPPGFPPYVNSQGYAVYNKTTITECLNGVCG